MTCRGCEDRVATGCLCLLTASDCFTVDGDGSQADPFTISPDLDPSGDNLIACGASGPLLASLPLIITDPPTVSLSRGGNQSIPNNALTAVIFSRENYDTDSMHSVSVNPSRITFTTAGVYLVTGYIVFDSDATPSGDRVVEIRKNGVDIVAHDARGAGGTDLRPAISVACQEQFSATDYVELLVHQTSGGALDVLASLGSPAFAAIRRGA